MAERERSASIQCGPGARARGHESRGVHRALRLPTRPISWRRLPAAPLALLGWLALASSPAAQAQMVPAAAVLTINATQFRPGETIAVGLAVANPPGNSAADLYVGAILPGGASALFFSGPSTLAGPLSVLNPATFPRFAAAPLGYTLQTSSFFQFVFPATGVAPGTYQLFAALVRQGALADNRIDAGDLLSLDLRPIVFGQSIALAPAAGPSGTFVNVTGAGFAPTSRISFGAAQVPGVFVSLGQLGFTVPFAQQGASVVALPAGPQPVQVDGGPSQTFTVTSLPANPNPPGSVIQGVATSTGQALASNQAVIESILQDLRTQSAGAAAAASSYLDTMSGMLSDVTALFTQDLTGVGATLDAPTLALLEQSLVTTPVQTAAPTFLPPAAALAGDSFLDRRQAIIDAGRQAARASQVLSALCPQSPSTACAVAGVAFSLTSTIADLVLGSSGSVVGLRVGATSSVTASTATRLSLRLTTASSPTLTPAIVVQRQLNALHPVRVALEIEAAKSFVTRALGSPGLNPQTASRLQRILQGLLALEGLAASLTADIPLQGVQELPVSISRVTVACPSDLFASVALDTGTGVVTLLRQAAFEVTRVCDASLRPQFVTRQESAASHEIAFTVSPYGLPALGPVRPVLAWSALVLVVGLMASQAAGWRRAGRRRRARRG